jgi:hypothetical protein
MLSSHFASVQISWRCIKIFCCRCYKFFVNVTAKSQFAVKSLLKISYHFHSYCDFKQFVPCAAIFGWQKWKLCFTRHAWKPWWYFLLSCWMFVGKFDHFCSKTNSVLNTDKLVWLWLHFPLWKLVGTWTIIAVWRENQLVVSTLEYSRPIVNCSWCRFASTVIWVMELYS